MDPRQIDELIDCLARIAHALEVLARDKDPKFNSDYTRAKARREASRSGTKLEE
jgi:hypothetical protein